MKKVRITVMKMACYEDLIEKYENPITHACAMQVGQEFTANHQQITHVNLRQHSVDSKFIIIFTQGTDNIIFMISGSGAQ